VPACTVQYFADLKHAADLKCTICHRQLLTWTRKNLLTNSINKMAELRYTWTSSLCWWAARVT